MEKFKKMIDDLNEMAADWIPMPDDSDPEAVEFYHHYFTGEGSFDYLEELANFRSIREIKENIGGAYEFIINTLDDMIKEAENKGNVEQQEKLIELGNSFASFALNYELFSSGSTFSE